ncbi:MAG: DUF1576 domain-containing protein [Defluviitaleaceae bacterium]|nr:DUF1576 domain-containing protein [Defluviitaleaceae bacterium]
MKFLKSPYCVHGLLFAVFIAAGFAYGGFSGVLNGLGEIFAVSDILVTDYIYIGGFGAALVNVGLAGLVAVGALALAKHRPSGLTIGTFGLVIGFAFFGKNPLNMIPIIAGGFLYGIFTKTTFDKCVLRAVLATCLAPVVTQAAYVTGLPLIAGLAAGIVCGLLVGFLINPFATHVESAHKGFNLYNVGFAAGILGMGFFVIYQVAGVGFATYSRWSSGYNLHLSILLAAVSGYFILIGFLCRKNTGEKIPPQNYFFKFHTAGYDFYKQYGEKVYIHMGIMGLACLAFMAAVRGEYSGPVIGAILSVVGFGAFGKTLASAAPIVAGAMLAAFASSFLTEIPFNERNFLVAAIFSTCLSPLANKFGIGWGLVAGFLHASFAVNVAGFHGGLNLYNNGFAGGLAAMILVPIILFLQKDAE